MTIRAVGTTGEPDPLRKIGEDLVGHAFITGAAGDPLDELDSLDLVEMRSDAEEGIEPPESFIQKPGLTDRLNRIAHLIQNGDTVTTILMGRVVHIVPISRVDNPLE